MRRREFVMLVGGAVAAWPFAARAQQPMPVIGFLTPAGGEASISQLLAAFRRGLAEAGYVEGKSLVMEYRFTNFKLEAMPEAASDLVAIICRAICGFVAKPTSSGTCAAFRRSASSVHSFGR